jgi:hypothetical protein
MAEEYDKVLDGEEFEIMAAAAERMADAASRRLNPDKPARVQMNASEFDRQALASTMEKVRPLHQSGVCGYGKP